MSPSVAFEEEREKYLAVSYEYSFMKSAYKDERFVETTWKEFLSYTSFVCSIYEKENGEYVGTYAGPDVQDDGRPKG